MYKEASVAVVVPAFNEETQIQSVIDTMPNLVDAIVIVDDCSTDRTAEIVEAAAKTQSRVHLIRHAVNQGVGGAIASGYMWARDNDMDIAVVMAGDGQMDPDDLPALLEPAVTDGVHYVKGNRLITGEAYRTIPKVRYFGNSVLSLLTKIASGYWHIADSQTGYTVIRREALQAIDWDTMYKRYGQPNDLLVKLNVFNFRVRDVPIKPVYNVGEVSGIKVRRVVFSISWLLLKGFLWRLKEKYVIRDFHPLIFFYLLGMSMFVLNVLFSIMLLVKWNLQGQVPEITALICVFTFATALQSAFFAMWFDMESNKDLR